MQQNILQQDELDALIRQCQLMDSAKEVYLTLNQNYWLWNIFDNWVNGRYNWITNTEVKFMFQIANGDYKECF